MQMNVGVYFWAQNSQSQRRTKVGNKNRRHLLSAAIVAV